MEAEVEGRRERYSCSVGDDDDVNEEVPPALVPPKGVIVVTLPVRHCGASDGDDDDVFNDEGVAVAGRASFVCGMPSGTAIFVLCNNHSETQQQLYVEMIRKLSLRGENVY